MPDQFRGFTNIGPSMDYLERAFDDAKYGWYSQNPYIDMAIQSTIDADMAPPGKHVLSCFIQYTPYQLRESDWDTEKENLGDTVQRTLERFFPGFGDLVLQREVRTPLDIERTVGLSEGNIFAGEFFAPADVLLPAGTGLEPVPHADRRLLPVRLGHPPGRLRDGRAGQARRRPDPQGPGEDPRVQIASGHGHTPARHCDVERALAPRSVPVGYRLDQRARASDDVPLRRRGPGRWCRRPRQSLAK